MVPYTKIGRSLAFSFWKYQILMLITSVCQAIMCRKTSIFHVSKWGEITRSVHKSAVLELQSAIRMCEIEISTRTAGISLSLHLITVRSNLGNYIQRDMRKDRCCNLLGDFVLQLEAVCFSPGHMRAPRCWCRHCPPGHLSGRHVDLVTGNLMPLLNHIAQIDADSEFHSAVFREIHIFPFEASWIFTAHATTSGPPGVMGVKSTVDSC